MKAKQTVTFTNLPTSAKAGEKVDLTFTSGASNNPIELTSANVDICSVQNKTVTLIAEGDCILEATQAGNEAVTNASARGVISVKSAGVFSLSVTDKDGRAITQAIEGDPLMIGLIFKAPTDDIGKTATFYLTASTDTTKLMLANGNWVTVTNPLQAAATAISLPKEEITLPLYAGTLGAGKYTISAKYQIGDRVVEATSVLNIITSLYAIAYADAKMLGKSEVYATAYATAKAARKSGTYAITYAQSKERGASDKGANDLAATAAASEAISLGATLSELSSQETEERLVQDAYEFVVLKKMKSPLFP